MKEIKDFLSKDIPINLNKLRNKFEGNSNKTVNLNFTRRSNFLLEMQVIRARHLDISLFCDNLLIDKDNKVSQQDRNE